jgi:hypothetical protein
MAEREDELAWRERALDERERELNRMVGSLVHPLAKVDPCLLVLDGVLHGLIERNPSETVVKFIQHNLPTLISELSTRRKGA